MIFQSALTFTKKTLFSLFCFSTIIGQQINEYSVSVENRNDSLFKADIYLKEKMLYVNTGDLSKILGSENVFANGTTKKEVINADNLEIKITVDSQFILVEEKLYQLEAPTFQTKNKTYVPLMGFLLILEAEKIVSGFAIDEPSKKIIIRQQIEENKSSQKVSSKKIDSEKKKWQFKSIIIDPGHGGKDPGAVGRSGLKEKDVALDVSKRLAKKIEKNLGIKTILTREEDTFIKLQDRTKFANQNEGSLFVSIHVNSAESRKAYGFETYFLSTTKNESAIRVAARENSVLELEGSVQTLKNEDLIRATIAQASFVQQSERLAAIIQQEIGKRVESKDLGVKQAGFYVLMGASMPNVLIELGFISNAQEEKKLKSSQYREALATSIYRAIEEYQKSIDYE